MDRALGLKWALPAGNHQDLPRQDTHWVGRVGITDSDRTSRPLHCGTRACRFGTIGNSVGETPGRVQIARFWCGLLARLLRDSPWVT